MALLLSFFLVGGCTSEASAPAAAAPETPGTVTPTSEPALHFVDGSGKDVSSVYVSDPVTIRITGLVPGSAVQVDAEMAPWKAHASFVAGADGMVDLTRDAPTEGTYSGVDADGLFWSMNTKKFEYSKSADVAFTVTSGEVTTKATLERRTTVEGMKSITPESSIKGTFFVPPGDGPHPAILAFGGSEGGRSGALSYAEDLVPQGYAVLAIAYFAERGLPDELSEVPLEYFDTALAWMKARPEVDANRMGVIGGSRGGELSLLLASLHPELKAAVADAPSSYIWGAVSGDGAAWTKGGEPLAYVPSGGGMGKMVTTPTGDKAMAFTPAFEDNLTKASTAELEAARIRVENASAAIAMFGGADDQLWPSCKFAQVAMDRLVASGHKAEHPDEMTCFEGAGHLINAVALPTTWSTFFPDPLGGMNLALGGTPAGAAHAGRARQGKVRDFFARTLKQ